MGKRQSRGKETMKLNKDYLTPPGSPAPEVSNMIEDLRFKIEWTTSSRWRDGELFSLCLRARRHFNYSGDEHKRPSLINVQSNK